MKITLKTKRASEEITVAPDESILFAGLRQGLALPHECASGTCGSCQAQHIEGDLYDLWADAPGKAHIPAAAERLLMCQTSCRAESTLKLFGRLARQSDGYAIPDYANGIVTLLEQINPDILVFRVKLDRGFSFTAGQFAMLRLPGIDGWRAYSMCQNNLREGTLEFVIKRLPGGAVSESLFNSEIIGQQVEVFGPLGRACLNHMHEDQNIVAIVGGSGVAGIMAVLQDIHTKGCFGRHKTKVFFGVKCPTDDFFLDRLSTMVEAASGQLDVTVVYSEVDAVPEKHPLHNNLRLAFGFVHETAFANLQKNELHADMTYFVAGPPVMVSAVETRLHDEFGVSADRIRLDRFG